MTIVLPPSWTLRAFDEIARIANGQVDPKNAPYSDMILLGSDHIREGGGGLIEPLLTARQQEAISGKYTFAMEQVIYSKIRPNLNKVYFAEFDGLCSADIYPIEFDTSVVLPKFAYYSLLGERFYKAAVAASMRSGIPKVNRDDLAAIEIALPPLFEQKRIVAVLDAWDQAIDQTERLIAAKRRRYRGLLTSHLFGPHKPTGKELSLTAKRVAGSNAWPLRCIGDFAREISRYNRAGQNLPVLSCTKHS
jgi:type I restriction enzyme S subunit